MDYRERLLRLQHMIRENGAVGAVLVPGSNFYYLTGMAPLGSLERLFLLLLPAEGEPVVIAPQLYENELGNWEFGRILLWRDGENPYRLFRGVLSEHAPEGGSLFVDDAMPIGLLLGTGILGKYRLERIGPIVSELRVIKSREEVEFLQKAAEIVDKTFYALLEQGLEGRTEKELATWLDCAMKRLGAEGVSFEPIVASGPNSANPHHRSTDRKIRKGDVVVFDYGARYGGYCSDVTRTVVVGKPSENVLTVYEVVKEAQEGACRAVRAGVLARDVDAVARETIAKAGYGEYFIHRTGHGLGLDVHEEPYISPESSVALRAGMVFTIEPGIYLPGKFGVRIEDDVLVEGGHGLRLTKATRELLCV
ncbi:aminopeptidase P family protein [Thermococcus sp. 21S7]|uniref:M24 family metallopeptidase n=1 Tax=Thermococcus sp. 21S7 TaxID=1638221 RepID=UPI0014390FA0|nr:aminopeptidase P family protein [Thermococcus sp. 21S7]NJE61719.1 aminopeptidase P family protein [Thermococcus sp. 21S7]